MPRLWPKRMSVFVLGVDTNVLVRFLTRDDAVQSETARNILTSRENQPIHISLVALVELVWVLTKLKRWSRRDVFEVCRDLLRSGDFVIESAALVEQCLLEAENAKCDFADALIAAVNMRAGCATTVTFDHDARTLAGMTAAETFS